MKLIVGLGNPGPKYDGTRHNVGFAVVDLLAKSAKAARSQERHGGLVTEMQEGEQRVLLVKPLTFMNLSGRCVRQFVDYYQIPLTDLLVICDDVNLPLGKLRARAKGTHGGHNGLRDIQNHLGSSEYSRLRIGVGAPKEDMIDYVLGRFRPNEKPVIEDALLQASQAAIFWVLRGIEESMNQYNAG